MLGRPLPLEITQHIFDDLRGEYSALLSCALTCRQLYPVAVRALYTVVRIRGYAAYNACLRLRTSADIQDLFVRTEELEFSDQEESWEESFLQDVLRTFANVRLPNLRYLAFRSNRRWKALHIPPLSIPGSTSDTFLFLRGLTLNGVDFEKFCDLVELVCALPQLQELYMLEGTSISQLAPPAVITQATGGQLRLQRLCLESHPSRSPDQATEMALLAWLTRTQIVQARTLRVLHMNTPRFSINGPDARAYHDTVARLLRGLGPSLIDLQIPTETGVGAALSHNTGLEELAFGAQPATYDFDCGILSLLSDPNRSVMRTLATLNTPRLRRLRLYLTVCLSHNFEGFPRPGGRWNITTETVNWQPLSDIIARKDLDDLQEVTIDILYLDMGEDNPRMYFEEYHLKVEEELKKLMWYSRGILKIVHRIS